LPPELQRVITDPPPSRKRPSGPDLCGGALKGEPVGGSAPGFTAMTFASADGGRQFAMSVTVNVPDAQAPVPSMVKSIEAVFCPAK
jgi:hypothetical protein